MTYGTSYYALKDRAALKAGETLLVLGAAGGVGSAAVELGKAMGARVIAAASSEEKVEAAKGWGADEGLVYPGGPFDRDGQKKLAETLQARLRRKGRRRDLRFGRRRLFRGGAARDRLGRPLPGHRLSRRHRQIAAQPDAAEILSGGRRVLGRLRRARSPAPTPPIRGSCSRSTRRARSSRACRRRFPLEEAGAAIAWLAGRQALGKVVVKVG